MTLEEAREILARCIQGSDLYSFGRYLCWPVNGDCYDQACLDGDFSADELEAIAVWMRAHNPEAEK